MVERLENLFLDKIEAAVAGAHNEGRDEGWQDGYDDGVSDGASDGWQEGYDTAMAERDDEEDLDTLGPGEYI